MVVIKNRIGVNLVVRFILEQKGRGRGRTKMLEKIREVKDRVKDWYKDRENWTRVKEHWRRKKGHAE